MNIKIIKFNFSKWFNFKCNGKNEKPDPFPEYTDPTSSQVLEINIYVYSLISLFISCHFSYILMAKQVIIGNNVFMMEFFL